PTSKIDTELCEPHAVDDRIRARIDLDSLAGDAVAAASTVCLLITLNIAGSLQITNQIVLSNVLTGADGLGGRVNTCRAREDLAAEQVVNARGKDDPVVDQNRNGGDCDQQYRDNKIGFQQEPNEPAEEPNPGFMVTHHPRRRHTCASSDAGNMIIRWTPNCH